MSAVIITAEKTRQTVLADIETVKLRNNQLEQAEATLMARRRELEAERSNLLSDIAAVLATEALAEAPPALDLAAKAADLAQVDAMLAAIPTANTQLTAQKQMIPPSWSDELTKLEAMERELREGATVAEREAEILTYCDAVLAEHGVAMG